MALKWQFFAISHGVALAGYQNIVNKSFVAHIQVIAHIYVPHINSTISRFQILLRLLLPFLKWKSWGQWASRTDKSDV